MPLLGSRGAASSRGFGSLANLGYFLRNSLRFRGSNNAYLSRTPSSTGNRKVWTWSGWVKRGKLDSASTNYVLMGCNAQSGNDGIAAIYFAGDQLYTYYDTSGANPYGPVGPAIFRDPAAWYHIVWAVDAANTIHYVYVNGTLISTDPSYYPPNYDYAMNRSGYLQAMGTQAWGANDYFDGYMAEVHFVDGQVLTPSAFAKTDATTGQWIPKKYAGTYGTNGFYLKFEDSSAVGKDSSGNGNNWSTSGHSVTPGVTYDLMTDVPTLTNATTANYATLNPLLYAPSYGYRDLTNGNLTTIGTSGTNNGNDYSTQTIKTGMWYAEFTCTVGTTSTYPQVGIISVASAGTGTGQVGYVANSVAYFADGTKQINSSQTSYGNSYTTNDVIGVAVDADNGAIYFGKQTGGTGSIVWQNSGVPTSGASKTGAAWTWTGGSIEFYFSTAVYTTSNGWHANFGQRPFSSTPPSGFKALNTYNLP